jgi:hypothetical protein
VGYTVRRDTWRDAREEQMELEFIRNLRDEAFKMDD